ncbi:hypothetical protein HHK36_020976 [Tetracentron sinense]|uniref:BHLH domain-containing protein n=1 Tax=Tetracentron sinense TaxID=13715 RepID=A0A835DC41_TETSI|nr:hypothetical protein HHK36_020976 [Tetracentron sinense]
MKVYWFRSIMPYSELNGVAKGKLESTQPKIADLTFMPDHEFVELVWENGQIMMQGQSSRTRKNPSCTGFSSNASKAQEQDGGDTITPKGGKFGTMESVLSDFSSLVPSGHMGLGQDDEIVRWLDYHLDDSLQRDYCSEFFTELLIDKNSNYDEIVRDSHMISVHGDANPEQRNASKVVGGGPETTRPRISQLYTLPSQQCQTSVTSLRVSDFNSSSNTVNAHQAACGNSSQTPTSSRWSPNTKKQKQDSEPTRPPVQPSSNMSLMNFSHFSRPAAVVKANLLRIGVTDSPGLSSIDRLSSIDKVSAAGSSNPVESTLIESTSGSRSVTGFWDDQRVLLPTKVDLKPSMSKPPKEPLSAEQSETIREDSFKNNRSPDKVLGQTLSFASSIAIGRPDNEKAIEPVVACSSVCSGNGVGGASHDPTHTLKRKSLDTEDSEYQSEDVEEESVGVRKPAPTRGGTGAKRSRAAEVHNLSERRRRDRINEKMRALQELIPNCNKMMSMRSGLCMPPMMLPPGMQNLHAPHMAHLSPMGVGMGMRMGMGVGGFGMGMFNMSGVSSGCPMIQVPPLHGAQIPGPAISGSSSLPGMPGSCFPMFGLPVQGLPMSMPHVPCVPLSGGPFTKSVLVSDVSGAAAPVEVPDSAPLSSSKDSIQNINSPHTHKTPVNCSQNQTSSQNMESDVNMEFDSKPANKWTPAKEGACVYTGSSANEDTEKNHVALEAPFSFFVFINGKLHS